MWRSCPSSLVSPRRANAMLMTVAAELGPGSSRRLYTTLPSLRSWMGVVVSESSAGAVPCPASRPALLISRRHQRNTSSRPRSSSWQEKTQRYEMRQQELQHEAERTARRRARYVLGDDADTTGGPSDTTAVPSRRGAPLSPPPRGFLGFLKGDGGGGRGRSSQPLNPLMRLATWNNTSKHDPEARASQRLLEAINALSKRNRRRADPLTVQLSEEQRQELVDRYASTRWYARLYAPFASVTERQVRWALRIAKVVLLILLATFIVLIVCAYYQEMDAVAQLSPEDRRDYIHMVRGMRYSDIYRLGREVLIKEDPLEALPASVRLHLVIEACRQRQWHALNWDVELRKMHPRSALDEGDYLHLLYWMVMQLGRATGGGGALFSDHILDVREVSQGNARSSSENSRFEEMEPTAIPARTGRSFFS